MHHGGCRGYNIGIRLVDEFLAKARIARCTSFKDTMDVIAKQVRCGRGPQGELGSM
jgi:hypothetical protein